jgi:excisionase family DNA binding protein
MWTAIRAMHHVTGGTGMSYRLATADLTRRPPTSAEIASALEAAAVLAAVRDRGGTVLAGELGETLKLPPAVSDLLLKVLGQVARGEVVRLAPRGAMLTTQQAADILNVSRPHLSGLLKDGTIPFVHVGSHRRVLFEDVMAFKQKRDEGRKKALDTLARLGQDFDAS